MYTHTYTHIYTHLNSQALVAKNLPANAGDRRDSGSILGLGRSPEGGHGNPLQYSCLEYPHGQEPGGLCFMGSQRVRHNWATKHSTCLFVDTWAKSISPQHIYSCKFKAVNDLKNDFTQLPSFYSWANWATGIKCLFPNLLPCSWQSPGLWHKLFPCLPQELLNAELRILISLYQETRHLISSAIKESSSEELTLNQASHSALGICDNLTSKGHQQHPWHIRSIHSELHHHRLSADPSWGECCIHFLAVSRPAWRTHTSYRMFKLTTPKGRLNPGRLLVEKPLRPVAAPSLAAFTQSHFSVTAEQGTYTPLAKSPTWLVYSCFNLVHFLGSWASYVVMYF